MGVVIVGSIALDSVQTPFGKVEEVLGGSAVYSSYAASFFVPVKLVGIVGTDFPSAHLKFLRKRKIDLKGLEVREGKTFRWSGFYTHNLNCAQTINTQLNVFLDFVPKLPKSYSEEKYLFLANIHPKLQLQVLEQINSPRLIAVDTMNCWIENEKESLWEVIKKVNIVFLNDTEVRLLCNHYSLVKAAKEILSLGPEVVIIKKGEHGCLMFNRIKGSDNVKIFSAPAFLTEVKDPTGAGDTFAGGFIGYLSYTQNLEEKNLRKAVILGSVLASYNVEDFSLERLRNITENDITNRYRLFKKMVHFGKIDRIR